MTFLQWQFRGGVSVIKAVCRHVLLFYLVPVLSEGLQDVGLACEISVGVLQALKQTLLQDQNRHSELVPQQLHRPEPQKTSAVKSQ